MKKIYTYIPLYNLVLLIFSIAFSTSSCKKSADIIELPADTTYSARIKFILQYNSSQFSVYYKGLVDAGLADSLAGKGPFTVFAIINNRTTGQYLPDAFRPLILKGFYPFKNILPNQTEIITGAYDFKYIVTAHPLNGGTTYTINGYPVQLPDQSASNGLIQVMTNFNFSRYYPTCLKAILNNPNYIEFAYALKRTHMDMMLDDSTKAYTVFVPNSLGGLSAVQNANLDSLTNIVKYHIIPGRLFIYDLKSQYKGDGINPDTIAYSTLNGKKLKFILFPGTFNPLVNYPDPDNTPQIIDYTNAIQGIGIFQSDVPSGLGVVQNIPNQLNP